MFAWLKSFDFLKPMFEFFGRLTKPEEVKIENAEIKKPLKEEKIKEKVEEIYEDNYEAYIMVLEPERRKRALRKIRRLVESGAVITGIKVIEPDGDKQVEVNYVMLGNPDKIVIDLKD